MLDRWSGRVKRLSAAHETIPRMTPDALSRRELLERSAVGAALLLGAGALPAEAQQRLPAAQLRQLRAAVRGRVLAPGNPGYNSARVIFNRRFDGIRPPAVVQVRDAADVQATVRWAARHDVPLVSRSGGHAYNGASTSRKAVVVDVGGLDGISLSGTTATIGPGAQLIDVYAGLARRGATVPAGSCPTVAIGGLALGGGVGLAGRALGLTLDRITRFDVVTADGQQKRVDASHEPDLYWALRGGGGSFAIVTAIYLRAQRVSRAAWFRISYPSGSREEALAAWDDLAPGAPQALTSICSLTGSGATVFGQYLGSESALRRVVAPLARVPGAQLSAGTSGYLALQRRWAGCSEGPLSGCTSPRSTFDASSIYVARKLSGAGRRAFVRAADSGATLICDSYGGAIGEVAPDATAFVHRDVRFSVQILSYASLGAARARVRGARRLIAPFGNGQAYQNYSDLDLSGPLKAYYGSNRARLVAIKTAVDPDDRFQPAQGIRPRST
jgi:FAD binding domain/Berberine and berberine like